MMRLKLIDAKAKANVVDVAAKANVADFAAGKANVAAPKLMLMLL